MAIVSFDQLAGDDEVVLAEVVVTVDPKSHRNCIDVDDPSADAGPTWEIEASAARADLDGDEAIDVHLVQADRRVDHGTLVFSPSD